MAEKKFQILSLDGGGIKGVYTAAVLTSIENDLGVNVTEHFDLIAGTSTGGIIAIGLGLGFRPRELLDMLEVKFFQLTYSEEFQNISRINTIITT